MEWVRKLVVETKTFTEEQQPLIPQKDSSCTRKNIVDFLALYNMSKKVPYLGKGLLINTRSQYITFFKHWVKKLYY